MLSLAPVCLLSGRGFERLSTTLDRLVTSTYASALLALLLVVSLASFSSFIHSKGPKSIRARLTVDYAREYARLVPPGSLILTHNPNMFLLWNKNAAQLHFARSRPDFLSEEHRKRYAGGIYFFCGYWCNAPSKNQQKPSEFIRERYQVETVAEEVVESYTFGLYRIGEKKNGE